MNEKRFKLEFIGNVPCIIDYEENLVYGVIEYADLLNELSEEKEYFERKKEYFLSKWSIAHVKNIQLRQEIKELEKENEKLTKENDKLKETLNRLEEAIEKREYEDIDDFY